MPATTPRTVDTIIESVIETQGDVNAAVDVRKGPLAVVVWAYVTELARTEEFVGYLQSLYQFDNAELIEEDDLVGIASNYGKDPNTGRATRLTVYIYKYSRPEPGNVYPIEIGTTVATEDGRYNYLTLNFAQMNGDYADIYFNATDQWYEIPVQVEAVNIGSEFDVPPYTVNRIISSLEDFDGCVNKEDVKRQGSDPIDPIQVIRNLQNTLQGVGTDMGGHIINELQDIDPTGFDDISFVPSSDFERFKRSKSLQGRLGYDVYLISDSTEQTIQDNVAKGGEFRIPLDHSPVLAVQYVTVNQQPVAFTFTPDLTSELARSPRAIDEVVLTAPLLPLQSYQISYMYYDFCEQANEAFQGRLKPFETDTLVRLAIPKEVYIAGEAIISSTGDRESVIDELLTYTQRWLRDPDFIDTSRSKFITSLDPTQYAVSAVANVDGLSDLRLTAFIRLDDALLPVEIIYFDGATEYPVLGPNFDIT